MILLGQPFGYLHILIPCLLGKLLLPLLLLGQEEQAPQPLVLRIGIIPLVKLMMDQVDGTPFMVIEPTL